PLAPGETTNIPSASKALRVTAIAKSQGPPTVEEAALRVHIRFLFANCQLLFRDLNKEVSFLWMMGETESLGDLDLQENSFSPQKPEQQPAECNSCDGIKERSVRRAESQCEEMSLGEFMPTDTRSIGEFGVEAVPRPIDQSVRNVASD